MKRKKNPEDASEQAKYASNKRPLWQKQLNQYKSKSKLRKKSKQAHDEAMVKYADVLKRLADK